MVTYIYINILGWEGMVAEEGERDAGAQELRGRGSASATSIYMQMARFRNLYV